MFRKLGSIAFSAGVFLVKGKILDSKEGSAFLKPNQKSDFLSSRNKGLLLDGEKSRISVKESFQNVCIYARVGIGKTTKYIIPNVLDKAKENASLVVNDPKGEVYRSTAGYMRACGFNVVLFNPQDINLSNLFNPLSEARNEIELEQVAEILIKAGNPGEKDPYWNNGAIRILKVLIKCLSFGDRRYFNLPNLTHLLQNFGNQGEGLEEWISQNCWDPQFPSDESVYNEWRGALIGSEKTIQTFVGICLTSLKALGNRDIRAFFSKSDYDLRNLRKKKTVIYFVTPPEHGEYYSFIVSLFFRSVFNECMRPEHLEGKSLPVYILYDEFGNSFINDFVSVATTIRGYGVSLSIVLQSSSQLPMKYGVETSKAIQGGFNTNMCLCAADLVTADYFSQLCGRVVEKRTKYERDLVPTREEYNLFNSDAVRTMEEDECLIISKNRHPLRLSMTPFYMNRKFKKASIFPLPPVERHQRTITPRLVRL